MMLALQYIFFLKLLSEGGVTLVWGSLFLVILVPSNCATVRALCGFDLSGLLGRTDNQLSQRLVWNPALIFHVHFIPFCKEISSTSFATTVNSMGAVDRPNGSTLNW